MRQAHDDFQPESRVALDQFEQIGTEEANSTRRLPRDGRGGARRLVQQRLIAEEISLAKGGQLDHLAVDTLLHDRDFPGEDDVHADA